ncbi:hypothetical protein R1sor_019513 [Riccia sorocarpa]|uniref:CFA20 domain-containing protein n=1 Tax=Riccia sorocarpa TaxID=122646 RepID=A0ABD3IDT9_9MARC
MASRGARSRYYPGANSLTLFSAQVYDRSVKGYVYSISGGLQSKLQLPKNDSKSGLQLVHHFLVFQVFVPPGQHFSVELRVSDSNNTRRKMYFSTSFSDLKMTPLHCQIPITMVTRNKWLSLSFHVADLFNSCFRGGVSFRSVDIIVLGPVCKVRKIFTMRCRITETSPNGYFEESSEYCLPQEHLYAVGVDSCIQILDMAALQKADFHNAEAITEDSKLVGGPESERTGRKNRSDTSRIVHVAFGTRMPLPLSTVQINTSLPHDNKCPPYAKERKPNESGLHEPKPVPNMITRAINAHNMHQESELLRKKVDKVLTGCKVTRGTQNHGSRTRSSTPSIDDKDSASSPRVAAERDSPSQDPSSGPALEPMPDSPSFSAAEIDDWVYKGPGSKWQGSRKKDSQIALQGKQRKEVQARNKEYKPSRYMDSPPGSPPCGWESLTAENNGFNAQFLEGSWINNQGSDPLESGKQSYCLATSLKEEIRHTMPAHHSARLHGEEETAGGVFRDSSDPDLRQSAFEYCGKSLGGEDMETKRAETVLEGRNGRDFSRASEGNACGESSGGQSWSSMSSDQFPVFTSGGSGGATVAAGADKLGEEDLAVSDLLGRLRSPLLSQELPKKEKETADKPLFDPEDELLFEKLLAESKKDMHASDNSMNGEISKPLTTGLADSLDFEAERDGVRDSIDFAFEETLLKMKESNRDEGIFIVEPVRSAFDVDPLQSKKSWQLSSELPDMEPTARQTTTHDDQGNVLPLYHIIPQPYGHKHLTPDCSKEGRKKSNLTHTLKPMFNLKGVFINMECAPESNLRSIA